LIASLLFGKSRPHPAVVTSLALALLCLSTPSFANPILTADLASFAVLGSAGVTNVPLSTIGGNLGSSPNGSVGGGYVFTEGSLQANTPLAAQAQIDLDAAILAVNAFLPDFTVADGDLIAFQSTQSGSVIRSGTYAVGAASANVGPGGTLVLDGGGSDTAQWYFQLSSTLITATTANVIVQNVGDGSGVGIYWTAGSAATLNGPTFVGNVLANTLISSDGNLTLGCGRLLSATGQVTLIQDVISVGCANVYEASGGFSGGTVGTGGIGGGGTDVAAVPEPGTLMLMASGLLGIVGRMKKRQQMKSTQIG